MRRITNWKEVRKVAYFALFMVVLVYGFYLAGIFDLD